MTQNDKPNTIRSLFDEAEGLMKDLGVCADSDSDEYQSTLNAALAKYQQCKDEIPQASLFSLNESLEDLATSDMRWQLPTRPVSCTNRHSDT
jgi:immunoglobulin-binding protein 1